MDLRPESKDPGWSIRRRQQYSTTALPQQHHSSRPLNSWRQFTWRTSSSSSGRVSVLMSLPPCISF